MWSFLSYFLNACLSHIVHSLYFCNDKLWNLWNEECSLWWSCCLQSASAYWLIAVIWTKSASRVRLRFVRAGILWQCNWKNCKCVDVCTLCHLRLWLMDWKVDSSGYSVQVQCINLSIAHSVIVVWWGCGYADACVAALFSAVQCLILNIVFVCKFVSTRSD